MKNTLEIDSTQKIPINEIIIGFAILLLIGSFVYYMWKMKGVIIYLGVIVIFMGFLLIYVGIFDKTI